MAPLGRGASFHPTCKVGGKNPEDYRHDTMITRKDDDGKTEMTSLPERALISHSKVRSLFFLEERKMSID